MTQSAANLTQFKSRGQGIFEYILLAVSLSVLALRATYSFGIDLSINSWMPDSMDILFDTMTLTLLITSFCLWLTWMFYAQKTLYRTTGIEIGLFLFIAGAVIATFSASDRRAAINDSIAMLGPILVAIMLVQILDSRAKVILVLCVVAALGVVSTYQCAEQFFVSNKVIIEQYKSAPETILGPLGIEPGSYNHMLLEHRIMSQDVRSFFTTGNSAGSFALLSAFAALAILLYKFKNRKSIAVPLLILIAIIFGLALTHSKGAIAASFIGVVLLLTYLLFGKWLKLHAKAVLVAFIFLFLVAGGMLIFYGLKHGRLPGGNSMLVRWQYWYSSAKMYADHPLTGVGPGNFSYFYTQYKIPSALETITNPHNFLLTIITQYGPLGLLGFLAACLIPIWGKIFSPQQPFSGSDTSRSAQFKRLLFILAVIISIVLLFTKPLFLKPSSAAGHPLVFVYAVFMLYIAPSLIFLIVCWLFASDIIITELPRNNIIGAVLFCAIAGCLIHNLIDFALFEPAIYMIFWYLLACLIALDSKHNTPGIFSPNARFTKILVAALILLFGCGFVVWYFCPVVKSTLVVRNAARAAAEGNLQKAHQLLADASRFDRLNALPPSFDGRIYIKQFLSTGSNDINLLMQAQDRFQMAIERNKADFKNYARLTEVYKLLAELSQGPTGTDWLQKAFDIAFLAMNCYPGSSQLHIDLAEITEQLGKNDSALEQYEKAVEIEDAYRKQFEMMYPRKKIFSRLGEEEYNLAKQRIECLSKQLNR